MADHSHESISPEIIARLTANTEPWLSYEECFEQLDAVIERLLVANIPLPRNMRVHLNACPACFDEAVSLAALIATNYMLSPGAAVSRLKDAVLGTGTRQHTTQ